jgi:glycine/D-amino acid oxidase-like deaminating enzyme
LIDDIDSMGREKALSILKERYRGVEYIRTFQPTRIGVQWNGAHECFREEDRDLLESCQTRLDEVNDLVEEATGIKKQFRQVGQVEGLKNFEGYISGEVEGALHPGKWIHYLEEECRNKGIVILNGLEVLRVEEEDEGARLVMKDLSIRAMKVIMCTNAYKLTSAGDERIAAVKNQVYLSQRLPFHLNGTFHVDRGYIYFRMAHGQILIGGARNMDDHPDQEMHNDHIKNHLSAFLNKHIDVAEKIFLGEGWMGWIAVGASKQPIIEKVQKDVWKVARLGGMGVAIGPQMGMKVVDEMLEEDA